MKNQASLTVSYPWGKHKKAPYHKNMWGHHGRTSITLLAAFTFCTLTTSCSKENYSAIYPVGTKFDYAAGSLHDLVQQETAPTNPFVIDSICPNTYGGMVGYYVSSSNGMHYTMSDTDIKVVK